MIRLPLILLIGFVCGSACGRQEAYLATSGVATWEFIQSVGGIRIGQPRKKDDSAWVLPVICDVSGLKTITQKPTAMNSGVVVTKMLHQIAGSDISISVVFNLPLSSERTSACQEVTLGEMKVGDYRVLYLEANNTTHDLGTITLQ
jgi:hypothetical protein